MNHFLIEMERFSDNDPKVEPDTKIDGLIKSLYSYFGVMPAKAGVQCFQLLLDTRLRGHDSVLDFLQIHQN
jgi:hypothetical protein